MAKVLICDDAMFMRSTLKRIVQEAGHTVIAEADDGKECIEMYQMFHPDIVLMDITMPDMNGIEATQKITDIDKNAKIIMVSAMGQEQMVFAAIKAGAKDFIVKPFEAQRIVDCIGKYVL